MLATCCRLVASLLEFACYQGLVQLCQEGDDALGRELRAADPLAAQRLTAAREQVRDRVCGAGWRGVCC